MTSYRVTWVIELDAESPVKAAELALEIQRDPESIATVFDVQDVSSAMACRIDLSGILGTVWRTSSVKKKPCGDKPGYYLA